MELTRAQLEAFDKFTQGLLSPEEQEQAKQQAEAEKVQRIEDAQIFFDVFGTGSGPKMLELLKHKTVYISTMDNVNCVIDGNIPLNPSEFMAGREMQNALVRWIERMIEVSQERVE